MNLVMMRQQRKNGNHISNKVPICVETYKCKKPHEYPQECIPGFGLSTSDRETLLSPVGWLTDSIVNAAQNLLYDVSPVPGLEMVACGLTMSFLVQRGRFCTQVNSSEWLPHASSSDWHLWQPVLTSWYNAGIALFHTQESNIDLEMTPTCILNMDWWCHW